MAATQPTLKDQVQDIITTTHRKSNGKTHNYPDDIKALALALRSQGLPYRTIGHRIKVPHNTISQWCNDTDLLQSFGFGELSDQIKRTLSNKLYFNANNVISRISDEDIDKAGLYHKALSSKIMIDAARLMDGQSTANISIAARYQEELESGIDEISTQIDELQKQIE